jgi:hypothetical protein
MGYILYGNRSYHMSKISYADMSQAWTHRLFHALSYSSSRISLSLVPSARQTSQFRHLMRPSLVALRLIQQYHLLRRLDYGFDFSLFPLVVPDLYYSLMAAASQTRSQLRLFGPKAWYYAPRRSQHGLRPELGIR